MTRTETSRNPLIGAILVVAACTLLSLVIPTSPHKGEKFDASAAPQLIAANNAFALELYRTVTREDTGENVMIAPTGICTVLALVHVVIERIMLDGERPLRHASSKLLAWRTH